MKTGRIKERNEIVKGIIIHNPNATIDIAYNAANDMMEKMYGIDWYAETDEQPSQHAPFVEPTPIVSIAEKNGEKGVRLCVSDVGIFIEARDLDKGEIFEWEKAMARLKEVGKRTFDKHEMYLIAACKDEINAKFKEIGGDELEGYYWSSTEYGSTYAWYMLFSDGTIDSTYKYTSLTVRPCAAF